MGYRKAPGASRTTRSLALFLPLLIHCLLAFGCAEKKPKTFFVGILSGVETQATTVNGFKDGMAALGYVENRNIRYDIRWLNDNPPAVVRILDEFLTEGVDMIFVFPAEASMAAKAATRGKAVPVVFAWSSVETTDLVNSVSRPGGNITGVRLHVADLLPKRLEILLQLAPRVKRVWLPYDPKISSAYAALGPLRSIAARAGVTLVETPLMNIETVRTELKRRAGSNDAGFDAIMLMPDAILSSSEGSEMVFQFAAARHLPVAAQTTMQVEREMGAIFSYSPENEPTGSLAATLADRILKGTPAGSIPVLSAEGSLWLNYRTIQALGLTVPEGLLRQAFKVIR